MNMIEREQKLLHSTVSKDRERIFKAVSIRCFALVCIFVYFAAKMFSVFCTCILHLYFASVSCFFICFVNIKQTVLQYEEFDVNLTNLKIKQDNVQRDDTKVIKRKETEKKNDCKINYRPT